MSRIRKLVLIEAIVFEEDYLWFHTDGVVRNGIEGKQLETRRGVLW